MSAGTHQPTASEPTAAQTVIATCYKRNSATEGTTIVTSNMTIQGVLTPDDSLSVKEFLKMVPLIYSITAKLQTEA